MTADGAAGAWHAKVATVLGLVVHHRPMVLRGVCGLLSTSHTVHQALLGVRGNVRVFLGPTGGSSYYPTASSSPSAWQAYSDRAVGLAQWLPRHASLVSSLELHVRSDQAAELTALQKWCAQALQMCRLAAAAAATTSQGPAAAEATPMAPTLRLCRVVLDLQETPLSVHQCHVETLLLQELAAVHLEVLHVHGCLLAESHRDAVLLGRLTALQRLTAYGGLVDAAAPHLPTSLRVLEATIVPPEEMRHFGEEEEDQEEQEEPPLPPWRRVITSLDLTHLKLLRELRLLPSYMLPSPTLDAKLPQQLTQLVALTPLSSVSGGEALQRVHVIWGNAGVLSSLVGLTGPWSLVLGGVDSHGCDSNVEEWKQAVSAAAPHLSSCSGLTALSCIDRRGSSQPAVFRDVGWCAAISALPQLQKLQLWGLDVTSVDLLQLTALSSLRSLHLVYTDACDSAVAASLASSLTGLTELILSSESINSCAHGLLSVLSSRVPGLCALVIEGGVKFVVCDEELLLLSGLTRLSRLALSILGCSDACRKRLLAALPALAAVEFASISSLPTLPLLWT